MNKMVNTQPAIIFKVNNRNTRTRCEICSKLTIKIPERHHSGVSINFKWVNTGWVRQKRFLPFQPPRQPNYTTENVEFDSCIKDHFETEKPKRSPLKI